MMKATQIICGMQPLEPRLAILASVLLTTLSFQVYVFFGEEGGCSSDSLKKNSICLQRTRGREASVDSHE